MIERSAQLQTFIDELFSRPLITQFNSKERDREKDNFVERAISQLQAGKISWTKYDKLIAEYRFRRPRPLFEMDRWFRGGWAIRPFWDDHKIAPPLPPGPRMYPPGGSHW